MLPRKMKKLERWILFAVVLSLVGCRGDDSPERKLLDSLRESPIFETDGVSVVALGPEAVKMMSDDAARVGIALISIYRSSLGDRALRLNLAYLLLMSEIPEYVSYVESHLFEASKQHELRLWVYVLEDKEARLTYPYRKMLETVLSKSDEPYVLIYIGKMELARGNWGNAAGRAMQVLQSSNTWAGRAYDLLMKVPSKPRNIALLPYLDSATRQGVHAATILVKSKKHRSRSMKYLIKIKASGDKTLGRTAARVLEEIGGH